MKPVLFVLLDDFADREAAFLAPALRGGVMPGFLNAAEHTGNTLGTLRAWGGANYTDAGLCRKRQAAREGNIVTANGSGYLEFARECLLAPGADTPEQIAASHAINKDGFYRE